MGKPVGQLIAEILRAESLAGWQARLTDRYFDDEAKQEAICGIRRHIAEMGSTSDAAELEALQEAIIRELIGRASRDAQPPRAGDSPVEGTVREELEDRVISSYPNPIAVPYRGLTEDQSAAGAFGCLLDTFESLLYFLGAVAVGAYLRGGLGREACNRHLLERLLKRGWSAGDLLALLRDTARLAGDFEGRLPYAELPGYLFDDRGAPTASLRVLESFVELRNRVWGHGTGRDDAFYAEILGPNRARLEQELAHAPWLARWELIRPLAIEDGGRVTVADLLMGERRLKGRPYDLRLESGDLVHQGGDVRPETSLLIVSPDRRAYLPLFPLALFHFRLRGEGVYFLQRPVWQLAEGRRRLRKAGYVAYRRGPGEREYEEGPGEPATRSIERHTGRLQARLPGAGSEPADAEPAPPADPDLELPEVGQEMEFHLRTFAGRDDLLARIDEWIDRAGSGGYLLLLGPPGQGKSALMAELGRRLGERTGCLLHMIKSHRNPHRFLPALIGQAARRLGRRFGPDAYRGDVDDLRNSLVRATSALVEKDGRAIVLLDAVDELEAVEGRLAFLPEAPPAGVRFVLTCRPDIPLVLALRARLRELSEWELAPLSAEDLPRFLERRLDAPTRRSLEGRIDWPGLFRRLQGNPLLLQRALDRIVRGAGDGGPAEIDPGGFADTLEALFQEIYDEIAGKRPGLGTGPGGRLRARLLQLLCHAREPLGLEPLCELMSADGSPLPLEDCRDRVHEMSQYLLDSGRGRFRPWHQGLVDFVREHILGGPGCRRAESAFADWLRGARPGRTAYGLRHEARHLFAAGRFDEVADLLTDHAYLEAKAEAGLSADLALGFAAVAGALPRGHPRREMLALLSRAFRRDLHFVARHPETLFQCLWNRCWWHDSPAAAAYREPAAAGDPPPEEPREYPGPVLSRWMEGWAATKTDAPGFRWVRLLRPPDDPLGSEHQDVFRGHELPARAVAFAPDGRWVASGSHDGTVRAWDLEGGEEVLCCRGHQGWVTSVAVAPDGTRIVSGAEDGTVRVWDARGGKELLRLDVPDAGVQAVAFAPDGSRLAAGCGDGTTRVWDAVGREVARWRDGPPSSGRVSFYPDGGRYRVSDAAVNAATYSCDGRRLITGSFDRAVRVLDAVDGTVLAACRGHEGYVRAVAVSPDGRLLASGSDDGTVRLWDGVTWAERACIRVGRGPVLSVAISPDGRLVASGDYEGGLRLWRAEDGREWADYRGHWGSVNGLAFSPDGRRLASAAQDRTLRIWDVREGGHRAGLRGHSNWVGGLAFARDGSRFASASRDGTARIWGGRDGRELAILRGHEAEVLGVAFSPDGARIATTSADGTARVWDADSGAEVARFAGHRGRVHRVAFGGASHRLASSSNDGTVRIWDADDGGELSRLDVLGAIPYGVALAPDGLRIACGDAEGAIRIWDLRPGFDPPGPPRLTLGGHLGTVGALAFSPDGGRLASLGWDKTVRVWDATGGGCLEVVEGVGDVSAIAAGPRRYPLRAITRGWETTIESSETGEIRARLLSSLYQVATHPDGRTWAGAHGNAVTLFTLEGNPGVD